jgi:tripartite-type tricarboxylate transporter receptor subunit TctC
MLRIASVALTLIITTVAHAQSYPSRPVRYIVPQAPGGSSDTLARIVTQRVAEGLGQQLVVTGIEMMHVPYKGSPPALVDLLAGRVPLMSSTMPPALPHIKSGRVRAIAVTSAKRSAALPDVPTVAESGVPGYEAIAWQGLVAPGATPKPVISRVNTEFVKVLKQSDVAAKLNEQGFETVASTPEWFAQYTKSEIAKWSKVIKSAGIKGGEGP